MTHDFSRRWMSDRDHVSRPLLHCLERPHRSALAHPIHQPTIMGQRVLINAGWYNQRLV